MENGIQMIRLCSLIFVEVKAGVSAARNTQIVTSKCGGAEEKWRAEPVKIFKGNSEHSLTEIRLPKGG